jgi:hypothetical protein
MNADFCNKDGLALGKQVFIHILKGSQCRGGGGGDIHITYTVFHTLKMLLILTQIQPDVNTVCAICNPFLAKHYYTVNAALLKFFVYLYCNFRLTLCISFPVCSTQFFKHFPLLFHSFVSLKRSAIRRNFFKQLGKYVLRHV